jgi:hypothetical protein
MVPMTAHSQTSLGRIYTSLTIHTNRLVPGGIRLDILKTDDIDALINERKPLPENHERRLRPVRKSGQQYRQAELEVKGEQGHDFKLSIRSNIQDPLDFSVILIHYPRGSTDPLILLRYNGRHSPHVNRLEGDRVTGCHIHKATQRYQEEGMSIDGYAIETRDYETVDEALSKLMVDARFSDPANRRIDDFGGG